MWGFIKIKYFYDYLNIKNDEKTPLGGAPAYS